MPVLYGFVDNIIYRNEENSYTVLSLVAAGEEVVATGIFPGVGEGETIEIKGDFVDHPVYGRQFKCDSFSVSLPKDTDTIRRFLLAGAIKGVGKAMTERLIKHFGADTLRVMESEPERLVEIKGISERIARDIALQMEEIFGFRNVLIHLQEYGISASVAERLYKVYGEGTLRVIMENPYVLVEDIPGFGFKTADAIAVKTGIHPDSENRIRSGLLYLLSRASMEGHTYLPLKELIERGAQLLDIDPSDIEPSIPNLVMDHRIKVRTFQDGLRAVYSMGFYRAEESCAGYLLKLNSATEEIPVSDDKISKGILQIENELGISLDPIQRQGVISCIRHGVTIITGGPGTGKTTTIRSIIAYFEKEGMEVLLAAPTGRAAKRMSQASGRPASTIHRMLELNGSPEEGERSFFERNEDNPLEADVIIIDEMSMVDILLFRALLRAIAPGTRLIMAGDADQLPSVGAGCVLDDIMNCGIFPVIKLEKVFRQAQESTIVVNAHRINEGKQLPEKFDKKEFFILERNDVRTIKKHISELLQVHIPSYVSAPVSEIQVLTPMHGGELGVGRLNRFLQELLNPPDKGKMEYTNGDVTFREGDKVMQTKNNYHLEWNVTDKYNIPIETGTGVFNGDMGEITSIDEFSETVEVMFDGQRRVSYLYKELSELELAYAITIHKSQGSEYPAVIMPIFDVPRPLMTRNLLYTGVTRAKKSVAILGSRSIIKSMIENQHRQERYSGLCQAILEQHAILKKNE